MPRCCTPASRRVRARLVVGADGAQSRVRELAGLCATRTDYGQTAIVAMVSTARPHEHTAWQRFLGDGTLAFLPLEGRLTAPSSGRCRRRAPRSCSPRRRPAFERELEKDFDGALGKVQLASERLKFPLWRLSASAVRHRAGGAGRRRGARGASAGRAGCESRVVRRRGAGRRARRRPSRRAKTRARCASCGATNAGGAARTNS